ncbi:MAG: ribosome biogenesis GTPase Der [Candidatus Zipacnadales bacterium]
MAKPVVAIIGRTNVGKSALFNRLVGARLAVVEDRPGVTRDRLYATAAIGNREVLLVDTGGLIGGEEDALVKLVAEHARLALEEADLLLFVVDGQEGLTSHDLEVADTLRKSGKPYLLVANKMDKSSLDSSQFLDLRLGTPIDVSATHNLNIRKLCEAIEAALPPEEPEEAPEAQRTAVAVVGRPNVGKSSLINALLGEERVIVSEIPGTTREAIDIPLSLEDKHYLLVDTAGLRRRSKSKEAVEFYSTLRSIKAIERADVVLLLLDATEGVTIQDQRIAGMAEQAGKATAILANKWDLVRARGAILGTNPLPLAQRQGNRFEQTLRKDFEREVRRRLPFLDYAEVLFISATQNQGLDRILPSVDRIAENHRRRIPTGPLNRALTKALLKHSPPTQKGRRLKIYYVTQAAAQPPTIVCFVNDPQLMHWSYERELINFFRTECGFEGTPLRFFVRSRRADDEEAR